MVLKSCFGETEEASVHSLFRSPGRQSFLNQYNSVVQKMILKRHFLVTLVKSLLCCSLFRSARRQSLNLVKLEKPLHIHCSGLLGKQSFLVDMIFLLERWSKMPLSIILGKTLLQIHC